MNNEKTASVIIKSVCYVGIWGVLGFGVFMGIKIITDNLAFHTQPDYYKYCQPNSHDKRLTLVPCIEKGKVYKQ